jgi:hypothetical protein
MSKDYEYLTSSSESMVYLTMLRLMLRRLARQNEQQFVAYKQGFSQRAKRAHVE